jgi:hypothetical protein
MHTDAANMMALLLLTQEKMMVEKNVGCSMHTCGGEAVLLLHSRERHATQHRREIPDILDANLVRQPRDDGARLVLFGQAGYFEICRLMFCKPCMRLRWLSSPACERCNHPHASRLQSLACGRGGCNHPHASRL